ncbi:hypothetical protein RVR_10575 [Actinacidiphila reveromycinica]|uniref:Uncharacterized protein n=1 Tax=Actinacidiphila reveromycinica TaxID=659352 RepID=A0A7U3UUM5_9ACTN|nr:hypothetical protein [Streptomyces sp. SN-593]BBB00576.1 hypothetical protein RVR_7708 [Streptomyces sp. SN-593]BBB00629.1 hypothetical protein RVR_10575 [Streptomyces sp. SN-593]
MVALVYVPGQDVGLRAAVVDADGDPAVVDDLAVTVTVTDPAGAPTSPAPAAAGGGVFTAVVPAVNVPGVWLVRWSATGTGISWADESQFQVRPAGVEQLVDLASVKAHLNLSPGDNRQDDELQGFILAAADLARDVVGPVLPEVHTEWHNGGRRTISLDWQPISAVASVTEYIAASTYVLTEQPLGQAAMDSYGYTLDLDRGTITRRAVGDAIAFAPGRNNVKVVYTAGRAGAVPFSVRLGALELIRHLWQLTQQGGRSRFAGSGALDEGSGPAPAGFALPNRVLELWKPFKRPPGVA